jgi:hypothetical protein
MRDVPRNGWLKLRAKNRGNVRKNGDCKQKRKELRKRNERKDEGSVIRCTVPEIRQPSRFQSDGSSASMGTAVLGRAHNAKQAAAYRWECGHASLFTRRRSNESNGCNWDCILRHVDECVLLRCPNWVKNGGFHTGCPTTIRCGSWPFKPPNWCRKPTGGGHEQPRLISWLPCESSLKYSNLDCMNLEGME